tara:strand:- start:1399 stop:2463 length:1065 start_codon:yes stop_codon:yes gene_type:complete
MNFEIGSDDFEIMKQVFEENNPELAENEEAIRGHIVELDEDIQKHLDEKPDGFDSAVTILWQGRNFFARYLGDEETSLPEMEQVTDELPNPIEQKHVAVFAGGGDGPFRRSVRQVLGMYDETLRIEFYHTIQDVLEALESGAICGVVAIHMSAEARIESHLRHDLKNMPGWNYDKAEKVVFPPCIDFPPPMELPLVLTTILEMQKGEYQVQPEGKFNLNSELSSLIAHMHTPKRNVVIALIDDRPQEIEGMTQILEAWPRIECIPIIQKAERSHEVDAPIDIWLLDEDMPHKKGSDIARELQASGFSGLLVSATAGSKPDFANLHFGNKNSIRKDRSVAEEFIRFINQLLMEVS